MERDFEETVQGGSSYVDGGNARRGQDHMLLPRIGTDISEECRLARPGLSCEEKGVTGVFHNLECILKLRIVGVDMCGILVQDVSIEFYVVIVAL